MVRRRRADFLTRGGPERRDFILAPILGRVYDLRGVPPGGLTRDVDTDQLFRKP